jgi:putative membrane protein
MIRTAAITGAAAMALSATVAVAQPSPGAGMSGPLPTPAYVMKAAQSDEFEITEARMALHHTTNPHVREFAQMMIHDHTQSTDMIKAALRQSGRPVPPPPPLSPMQQQMVDGLRAAGPKFDRVYINQQVQAHELALHVHQTYAQGGDNPALRHTAEQIVPVVQHHLSMAEDIQSHVG